MIVFYIWSWTDKAHGKQFSQQFEDSCSKLENYVSSAEQQIMEQKVMIEMLEQSQVFYDEQYREARIVANVSQFLIG